MLSAMPHRGRLVAIAAGALVIAGVAAAGGFANGASHLPDHPVGTAFDTGRSDITVRRAWVADLRPGESAEYGEKKRRLFVEVDFSPHGFESENPGESSSWGPGPSPELELPGREPVEVSNALDATDWQPLYFVHPGVPERLALEYELPAGAEVPDRARLRLDRFVVSEDNLLIPKIWRARPAVHVDVPIGPAPKVAAR
jgi:hypothetical protein